MRIGEITKMETDTGTDKKAPNETDNKANNGFKADYEEEAITFAEVSVLPGITVIEFGAPWCGYCQAAQSAIREVLNEYALNHDNKLSHIKVFDGKGKRLGRAFKVKHWPTLILLKNGNEVARLVRPLKPDEVRNFVLN